MNASSSYVASTVMDVDDHLTRMLESMSLAGPWTTFGKEEPQLRIMAPHEPEVSMSDSSDSEDSAYHPSDSPSPRSLGGAARSCGCGLLQSVLDQLDAGLFRTTGGDYLDLILTHREAFFAFPQGHRLCAIGFSEIAQRVETRRWRVDREGDAEAVNAFRNEAWVIANANA